jgi:hypothetical protein
MSTISIDFLISLGRSSRVLYHFSPKISLAKRFIGTIL